MAKVSSKFVCQQCGNEYGKWFGKCPDCGEWNSLVETVVLTSKTPKFQKLKTSSWNVKPVLLTSVSSEKTKRISTRISELDRVLGGGLVAGQVVLIAGEPGIGKSTLLLQVANQLSILGSQFSDIGQSGVGKPVGKTGKLKTGKLKTEDRKQKTENRVYYVSGEESVNQIKIRANRLGVNNKNILMLEETDVDLIVSSIESVNQLTDQSADQLTLIIDSIQTMQTNDLSGMAGSVGQVRECAYRLVKLAKSKNIAVFIVGHVTKQGSIAGPSVLMHIVDTVLWFEGDRSLTLRILRARKNRFGPTDEVGVFLMEDSGLVPIDDPEKIFLTSDAKSMPGSVIASIMEGTRPMLVEVQALVVPTKMAYPKRIAQGFDSKRLELLLAVLIRRCGLPLYETDCFVNVAGGISIKNDPSADLAICLAVASAYFDKSLPNKLIAIGEVGLLGDIREVVAQEKRIKEAGRLGYRTVISSNEVKYLGQVIKKYL